MPPEMSEQTNETGAQVVSSMLGNSPEARNPDGSMKEAPSATPEAKPAETKPEAKPGETKSTPPSSETKPSEGAKPSLLNAKDGEKAPESIATGAPENYEFKDLPQGFEVTDAAKAFFKDAQMSQAQADKAVKFYQDLAKEAAEAPFKLWDKMNSDWVKQVESDQEYKGDMTNVRSTIAKFVDSIGDAKLATDLREAMDMTGAGNHPAFVKFMFRMAQQFTEGKHVPAGGPSPHGQRAPGTSERPSAAHALFPNLA